LSRSGKKVLHIDKNEYYGDSETALGIEEIQKLAEVTNGSISNVIIAKQDVETRTRLASTRPYNLSLSPHIFYTRSHLLPTLVSSKAHDQLEFLAVGNWFVYQNKNHDSTEDRTWRLVRVPNTREDIFSDTSLSMRTKGALVKLIRFVMDFESESNREKWNPAQDKSFAEFAKEQFKIPEDALPPVIALVLDLEMEKNVTTKQALRGIHRHLTSMGVFGSGFCAVLPKYGGLSEIIQVACRAAAVGGAVYVLNKAVTAIHAAEPDSIQRLTLTLEGEDVVMTDYLIGTSNQLPMTVETGQSNLIDSTGTSRRISIVDSKLSCFFPTTPTESAPTAPSVVVIVFPSMSVTVDEKCNDHPIHLLIHNGDTAECPNDQCKCLFLLFQFDAVARKNKMMIKRKNYLSTLSVIHIGETILQQTETYSFSAFIFIIT